MTKRKNFRCKQCKLMIYGKKCYYKMKLVCNECFQELKGGKRKDV